MVFFSRHIIQLVAVLLLQLTRAEAAVLQARDCYLAVPALEGETCQQVSSDWGISLDDFIALNPGVVCPNLVAGHEYCVMGDRPWPSTTQPPTTTTAPGTGIETPQPIIPGMVTNCNKFGVVKSTTTCKAIIEYYRITASDLYTWNPRLASKCDENLTLGSYYCAGVILSTPPSTTAPPNGVTTPYPLVGGVVSNCNKFALVQSSTTCERIIDYYKITLSDLVSWNADLKSNCNGGLSLGAHACVGVIGGTTNLPPTTTAPGNGITTPSPIQSGMVKTCNKFAEIKSTTTCQGVLDYNKISLNDFVKWNPAVKSGCTNLQTGTYVCVGVIGSITQPPTTVPTNGIKTPTPTQTGMVTNCNKFAEVKATTTCQGILDYNKISLADFYKWNPAVGKNCESLWRGSFACVGIIGGTTTQPANPTPTPTQTGMVKGCTKWHFIKETTTCQGVLDYNNISLEKFVKWNPAVGKNCENLWRGTYACVKGP